MTAESPKTIRVGRHFAAPQQRVFDAWLDPSTAGQWLFATPAGEMVRVEIDARVGGRFVIVERRGGEDVEHTGQYLEIDRPRRLVFTFAVPKYSAVSTQVSIDITPAGGGCDVVLTHEGVLADYAEGTKKGWTTILDGLAETVEDAAAPHGFIAGSGTVRFERLLPGPIERVWAYLTDSEKRGEWFASGPMASQVGAEGTFHFDHNTLAPADTAIPEKFRDMKSGITSRFRLTRFEPPHRLSFIWDDHKTPSEVSFALAEEGPKVRLTLVHSRLADRAAMIDVAGGWHAHLAVLGERLHQRTPSRFWSLLTELERDYENMFADDATGAK